MKGEKGRNTINIWYPIGLGSGRVFYLAQSETLWRHIPSNLGLILRTLTHFPLLIGSVEYHSFQGTKSLIRYPIRLGTGHILRLT